MSWKDLMRASRIATNERTDRTVLGRKGVSDECLIQWEKDVHVFHSVISVYSLIHKDAYSL